MKKYLILFFLFGMVVSCTNSHTNINKRIVTVTIEPLRYFTEQIAGDKFTVVTMVPAGSSPETYEPTARQMVDLSKSDLYIKVGDLGFERTWMKKMTENAPHIIIIDSSDGIESPDSDSQFADPHTWTSPANARIIADNIYHALCDLDNKDSLFFKHRLAELYKHIDAVDFAIRVNLRNKKNECFLIYHPSLTYFAHKYGLKQIPIEEEGKEPSAAQLQQMIKTAKTNRAKILFVQQEFNSRNTDIIAHTTGARQIEINPLSYNWCEEMVKVSEAFK